MDELVGVVGTFSITSGQTVSDAINLNNRTLLGLQFATFTGVAVTFQGSSDGITYVAVKDTAGASVSFTVASDTYVVIQPAILAGLKFVKLVSGSAEGANRTVTAIGRHCS
jgi:hypothetical protein